MEITREDLNDMEKRYRAKLINSLSGFKSVGLIGSVDKEGKDNLAIFSSGFHLGADPALMGIIIRPASVPRHTYENILETKFYTFNHINENIVKEAHQTSARYDREQSEFDIANLNREYLNNSKVPFVKESRLKFLLNYREHHELKINNTIMVIGEIVYINCEDKVLREDGSLNIENSGSLTTSGLDCYHRTEEVVRLSYAKTDKELEEI